MIPKMMRSICPYVFWITILIIIATPAFASLLRQGYFSMHDDQHVVRLHLLHQSIMQGVLFPRWVDGLGFGYGYPLFNFYPSFIYYVAEIFHLTGISLIWSLKFMLITGFITAAFGMYLLGTKLFDRFVGVLSATLYTYFFYHAVNAYVRGAFAEFISMSVLPFIFHASQLLYENQNTKRVTYLGVGFAVLILTHPLIAFPSLIFIGIFEFYHLITAQNKFKFLFFSAAAYLIGLGLSAFFWLPSMFERSYTFVDDILTKELASYLIHFVYPQQLLSSLWGYGGSIAGPNDGITFQLGNAHILLLITSIILFIVVKIIYSEDSKTSQMLIITAMFAISIFMMIPLSNQLWNNISFLWYLQFPWRFMTFAGIFLSIIAAASIYYMKYFVPQFIRILVLLIFILMTVSIYGKYFQPRQFIDVGDDSRITKEEISWRISKSSFEFVPKGIKTKKTKYNTTALAIEKSNIPFKLFQVENSVNVKVEKDIAQKKIFNIDSPINTVFRLNTFYFPGWNGYARANNSKNWTKLIITDENDLKLITSAIPKGKYQLKFAFEDTGIRKFSNTISQITVIIVLFLLLSLKGSIILYIRRRIV